LNVLEHSNTQISANTLQRKAAMHMTEIRKVNEPREVIPRNSAVERISAKGLRSRADVHSFFERTAHPNSAIRAAAALNHSMRMGMASLTGGLSPVSPVSLGLAMADWAGHRVALDAARRLGLGDSHAPCADLPKRSAG
jgi:hypothetical protein